MYYFIRISKALLQKQEAQITNDNFRDSKREPSSPMIALGTLSCNNLWFFNNLDGLMIIGVEVLTSAHLDT